jgi:short-subunit dehydrogenase
MDVLITGSSRGIGLAVAKEFLQHGDRVLLTGRDPERLRSTRASLDGDIISVVADLSTEDGVRLIQEAAATNSFNPNVIVLCAGVYHEGSIEDATSEEILEQINVNLVSQILLVKALAQCIRQNATRIIIVGSTASFGSYVTGPIYGITKWALRGLAENLRDEFRSSGVGVTIIHPGPTWTDLWDGADISRNRLLEPSDIAIAVWSMSLLSKQAVVEEMIIRAVGGDIIE